MDRNNFNFKFLFSFLPNYNLNKPFKEGGLNLFHLSSRVKSYKSYYIFKLINEELKSFWQFYMIDQINNLQKSSSSQNILQNKLLKNSEINNWLKEALIYLKEIKIEPNINMISTFGLFF